MAGKRKLWGGGNPRGRQLPIAEDVGVSTKAKWRKGGKRGGSLQFGAGVAGARPHAWGGQPWKRILSGTPFSTPSVCCVCFILHTLPVMMGSFPHTLSVVRVLSLHSRSAVFAFSTLPVVCVPPHFGPAVCVCTFPILLPCPVCIPQSRPAVCVHVLHSICCVGTLPAFLPRQVCVCVCRGTHVALK